MADEGLAALADEMEARGDAYSFLARVLSDDEAGVDFLEALRDNPPQTGTALDDFASSLAGYDADALEAVRRESAADHAQTLLGMSAHPVSPFESVYLSGVHLMMQASRDEVRAAYAAAGCAKSDDYRMPDDHVSLELDFMAVLSSRAAQALRALATDGAGAELPDGTSAEQAAQDSLNAQLSFVDDHLTRWIPQFCEALERQATTDLYRGAAQMLDRLVGQDALMLHALSADDGQGAPDQEE